MRHLHASIRDNIHNILELHQGTKQQQIPFNSANSLFTEFRHLETLFGQLRPIQSRSASIKTLWSLGKGSWASIPWFACLDSRSTTSIRTGIYVVYLFREDMSGLYVTLNQGVTSFRTQQPNRFPRIAMHEAALKIRELPYVQALTINGFNLDDDMDLKTDSLFGKDYQSACIAYKLYQSEHLPIDTFISSDLESLLQSYNSLITKVSIDLPNKDTNVNRQQEAQAQVPKIFISHSHQDTSFCSALSEKLIERGFRTWYDEHNLGAGRLMEVIETELSSSDYFVIAISSAAVNSKWVTREYQAAINLEDEEKIRTIIPVVIEDCEIPLMLRTYKRVQPKIGEALDPTNAAEQIHDLITIK